MAIQFDKQLTPSLNDFLSILRGEKDEQGHLTTPTSSGVYPVDKLKHLIIESTTKDDVGLGNVENLAPKDLPMSDAQATINDNGKIALNKETDRAKGVESGIINTQNSVNANQTIANTAFHDKDVEQDVLIGENIQGVADNTQEIINNTQGIIDNANQVLGVGQTWQNVLTTRDVGTTYTNNTGRPISVSITYDSTQSGELFVDNVKVARLWFATNMVPLFTIVPNLSTYRVEYDNSSRPRLWSELR